MSSPTRSYLEAAVQEDWTKAAFREYGLSSAGVTNSRGRLCIFVGGGGTFKSHPAPCLNQSQSQIDTETNAIFEDLARDLKRYLQRTPTRYRRSGTTL